MKTIGFIGLGNVGHKLAGSLVRNGYQLVLCDLDQNRARALMDQGALWEDDYAALTGKVEMLITCLPAPEISAQVLEGGVLDALSPGQVWAEMSTTNHHEVHRLGAMVQERGAHPVDCPVSGGCHRAATGNISIFAGCERHVFDTIFPVLTAMGRRILHTGGPGSASILKVLTNYLATANLVTVAEALITAHKAGMDLRTTYEAIRISSGNSFVHETEGQVILNGSRDINFTMDLVLKDISLFHNIAQEHDIPLDISPVLINIFKSAIDQYGPRENSPNIIRRWEEACGCSVQAPGFPAEIVDTEPEEAGHEVKA